MKKKRVKLERTKIVGFFEHMNIPDKN